MTSFAVTTLADESTKSGPIGLVVILVLCIVCYFLFKSMSRHMRKVREGFGSSASAESSTEVATKSNAEPTTDQPDEPQA